jgi:hypothetical protein
MRFPAHSRRLAFGFILSTSWLAQFAAKAVTIDWDGQGPSTDWENAVNWTGDLLPGLSDIASIGGATIDLSSAQSVNGFASSEDGILEIGGGGSLSVGSGGLFNEGNIFLSTGFIGNATLAATGGSVLLTGGGTIHLDSTNLNSAGIAPDGFGRLLHQPRQHDSRVW